MYVVRGMIKAEYKLMLVDVIAGADGLTWSRSGTDIRSDNFIPFQGPHNKQLQRTKHPSNRFQTPARVHNKT